MTVFDASALLAYLLGEPGADDVRGALKNGGVCGAANWSEVAQKVRSSGADWEMAALLLRSYGLDVEPVTERDAEDAASLWRRGSTLSLADRLCLALGARLGVEIITCDREWSDITGVRVVR